MNEKNAKWHQMAPDAVCQQLHTNAACGISRKAARSRCKRDGANTLFDVSTGTWKRHLRAVLCDPAILLLLFCTLMTATLTNPMQGLAVCLLLAVCVGAFVYVLYRYYKDEKRVAEYRIPRVHVLREGKLLAVSARRVVRGDILLLREGDIVPCDCRLLRGEQLRVLTLMPSDGGKAVYTELSKNADIVYPYGSDVSAPKIENMLFGGSEILSGEAYAVAVAVGEHSYLGAMQVFELPEESTGKAPELNKGLQKLLRAYGVVMLILLLLFTVIGLFTQTQETGIMELFLPLCVLCAAASPALLSLYVDWIRLCGRDECMRSSLTENRAVIKSERAMERLSQATDLFVIGRRGLSDGVLHFYGASIGGREYLATAEQLQTDLQTLCEAFALRRMADAMALSTDLIGKAEEDAAFLSELRAASGFDEAAMRVRLKRVSLSEEATTPEECVAIDVQMRETAFRLCFSQKISLIDSCSYYEEGDRLCTTSFELRTAFYDFYHAYTKAGCRVEIVAREHPGQGMALVGIVALREEVSEVLPPLCNTLAQNGVRTCFFITEDLNAAQCYANACKLPAERICRSTEHPHLTEDLLRSYHVFLGFPRAEIAKLLTTLRQEGRRVAVLGGHAKDICFLNASYLMLACDAIEAEMEDESAAIEHWQADGREESQNASQAVRRHADVILPRARAHTGGVAAVTQAFLLCRTVGVRTRLFLTFLTVSQLMRLLLTALAVCTGVGLIQAVPMMLFSFLTEAAVLALIASVSIPKQRLTDASSADGGFLLRTLTAKGTWVPIVASTTLTVLYTIIWVWCGVMTHECAVSLLALSLFLGQLTAAAVLLLQTKSRITSLRAVVPFLVLLLLALIALLLSILFKGVSAVTGLGIWSLLSALSLPILPLSYLLSYFLCVFLGRTAK
ncbi:MAG: cation-transporting P-type ATPase [Clostridia bacterium]|nr:cation-transporting P-type ATPase [Clostridia bacterium]